jgi:hypothetical protein
VDAIDQATFAGSMLAEAHTIVDAAALEDSTLRLVGGLAVYEHCRDTEFCARSYRDIDLVGLREQARAITEVLTRLGWTENRHAVMASAGQKRQFLRACRHHAAQGRLHEDDRIDLYLDRFRLHHAIDLRRRMDLDPYTVSVSDVVLMKLQRSVLDPDDLRDILVVLKDAADVGEADAGSTVNARYIARLCARDWGLYHDVTTNLERCRRHVDSFGLATTDAARLRQRLARLQAALEAEHKTVRWRVRARFGERLAWHEPVDETDGVHITHAERL